MCEILNVHVQKVDKGMGSIPVSRFFIYSGSLDFTRFPLFLCGCRPAPTCTQSEHPKINLLQVAKAAYGCQGTRYGAVLSKVS